MLFKKDGGSSAGGFEYLIAGLGNPGKKYEFTRHNTGFLCLDLFAEEHGFKIDRLKFKSLYADERINGRRCLFLKPQTFMNLSGEAVRDAANFYKIPPEKIIVVFDDISLEVGKMRIRRKGSDGGHNGIKNIIYHLGSNEFPRIKIGVGAKPHPDFDLADWVVSPFSKQELLSLRDVCKNAGSAIETIVGGDIDAAMSKFSR